jgi:hypothetical protein
LRILTVILTGVLFGNYLSLNAQGSPINHSDFFKADSVAALFPNHSLANTRLLSLKLTEPFIDEVDKFRAIYKWVCENIENDYSAFLINKRKRNKFLNNPEELNEWDEKFSKDAFKKLREKNKTVCTGYAYLIKELAFHAGIESVIINGYGRNSQSNIGGNGIPNHSWNGVKLDNQWFLCDPTWSSGYTIESNQMYVKKFQPGYFLADPILFITNHYPLNTKWTLMEEFPSIEKFLNGPLIYVGAYDYSIKAVTPEIFEYSIKKGEELNISFRGTDNLDSKSISVNVLRYGKPQSISSAISKGSEGINVIRLKLENSGVYTVHIMINGDPIITYTVDVMR